MALFGKFVIYIYIYIYIFREREREIDICNILYIYIYVYIAHDFILLGPNSSILWQLGKMVI